VRPSGYLEKPSGKAEWAPNRGSERRCEGSRYAPDLNPIEEAFWKIKRFLQHVGARTPEVLVEATGKALDALTAENALGLFTRGGYRTLEQQRL
jgi:hypothetical protein